MFGAETIVEGFVPSVAGAVQMTRSILTSATTALQKNLLRHQSAAFGQGGHQLHGGHAWAPLERSTVAIKTRLGVTRPAAPLYRTGAMSGNQKVRVRLRSLRGGVQFELKAWNRTPYAKYHQSGFRHVWSGKLIVPRMPVEFSEQDLLFVTESIRSFMVGGSAAKRKKGVSLKGKKSWINGGDPRLWLFFNERWGGV